MTIHYIVDSRTYNIVENFPDIDSALAFLDAQSSEYRLNHYIVSGVQL